MADELHHMALQKCLRARISDDMPVGKGEVIEMSSKTEADLELDDGHIVHVVFTPGRFTPGPRYDLEETSMGLIFVPAQ
jgi:hypothetical protein